MLKFNNDALNKIREIDKRYYGLGFVAAIAVIGLYCYCANQISIDDEALAKKEITFNVPPGTPAARIPTILEKAGVEVNNFYFKLSMRLSDADKNFHAGYYRVYPDDTVGTIIERLKKEHLEGIFAPDTYNFHANVSDLLILKKAYQQQQAILTEEWTNRGVNCQVKTPYEALILASIVEREVGRSEDRPIVAGIFSNRLRIKMPLQTDPSVIYGEGESFGGDIKREHLRRNTPYNTYRFVGLPPTPIGNPTRESIHAVLHPAQTDYLYFINKANGDLVPSKTLEEHNRAVRRYILNKGK